MIIDAITAILGAFALGLAIGHAWTKEDYEERK
jgi:hypothetical protein